jgi:hypothetical protein
VVILISLVALGAGSGCDLSPRAIERARLEASRRNVDIHFSVANMLNLTSLGESHYDAVICMDNALPHLAASRPIGFVYFLAGLEIGIVLIGGMVFLGLHALQNWRHHMIDQSKQGSALR